MLRILILITCMFLFPDIYGASIFQFCGRYEYNCNYYDGKLYMNLAKIPCHELVITQVDISNNCLDGYLYDFEGEKRLYHIDIVTENGRIYITEDKEFRLVHCIKEMKS